MKVTLGDSPIRAVSICSNTERFGNGVRPPVVAAACGTRFGCCVERRFALSEQTGQVPGSQNDVSVWMGGGSS